MKIALLGNQNSGKTSLFNSLTGSNQKVGNWPGVTIDRIEGEVKKYKSTITDLPGVYSLSPYTSEEAISRQFVLEEDLDLIINIVDATSLERSLYLTTQLLELDVDVVIALNMYDLLEHKGIKIDFDGLSKDLGVTIVPISAMKGYGIAKLKEVVFQREYLKNKHKKIYPDDVEQFIDNVNANYKASIGHKKDKHKRFSAVKILEEDRDFKILMDDKLEKEHLEIEKKYGMDGEQLIASLRYDYIEKIKKKNVIVKERKETGSDKLDRIFLNKYLAIPIFVAIMAFVYFISISLVGGLTSKLIDAAFNGAKSLEISIGFHKWSFTHEVKGLGPLIAEALQKVGASPWSVSLISNGLISGLSAVLSFVPQLITLFFFLGILETTGYMSRIAFFLDRVFHKFGLSGKSLIPFIVGAGCSVPGIMTTRTIEDENERQTTVALVPFVPCNAKLPLISLISAAFFKTWGFAFALLFYIMAIIIIFVGAYIVKKILKKKEHSTFISELPNYKSPNPKYIMRDVIDKTIAFFKRAGTVVVFFSIIVCALTIFTFDFRYIDGKILSINDSMLAKIGGAFSWFFYPMLGLPKSDMVWAAAVSSIQGLVAKEQIISSMKVIAGASGSSDIFLSSAFSYFKPVTAFAFASFNLFSIPCIGSISAMHAELKSYKKTFIIMGCEILLAWIIASAIGIWGALL